MQVKPPVRVSIIACDKYMDVVSNWWIFTQLSHARVRGMHLAEARLLDRSQTEQSLRMKSLFLIWLSPVKMPVLSHTFALDGSL